MHTGTKNPNRNNKNARFLSLATNIDGLRLLWKFSFRYAESTTYSFIPYETTFEYLMTECLS